jgi:hypothetical protein
LRNVGFVATIAVKHLGMEVTFPVSGHLDILDPTRRGHQITAGEAVAIAVAAAGCFLPISRR